MNTRSVVALLGLAICFTLPTFAQQTNTPDPQLRQKLVDAIKKHTDALDKNDAAAVAANFTEDGILVTPGGTNFGREAIEKYYVDVFKQVHLSNNLAPVDEDSPYITTDGKQMWATGVNAQERSREQLLSSLRTILAEALEFNRKEAREAAESGFEEETLSV